MANTKIQICIRKYENKRNHTIKMIQIYLELIYINDPCEPFIS